MTAHASSSPEELARELAHIAFARAQIKRGSLLTKYQAERVNLEGDWRRWLLTLFPATFSTFAPHHERFWQWVWSIEKRTKPRPFVGIWPRHSGKSTAAEVAAVALGAMGRRSYILYVSATQSQADDHVQNIASLLESETFGRLYPRMANRRIGKYGAARGWRRNRLSTDAGVTIDAVGLDTASRGLKVEDDRPDLIIVDDVDEESDTREVTLKKIRRLTHAILPAGSHDAAELFIQNLILPDGIFARLANLATEPADFLLDREVSGPHPALLEFEYEIRDGMAVITHGVPTWDSMGVQVCQQLVNTFGLEAFESECQHMVRRPGQVIFVRSWWPPDSSARRFDTTRPDLLERSCAARFLHLDTAQKDKDVNDYTACAVLELTHGRQLRLRWVHRARLEFPELVEELEGWAHEWNHDGKLKEITIEDKSSGTSLIQTVRRQAPAWMRRKTVAWQPRGSKEERARLASTWCRRGYVILPRPHEFNTPWLFDFESELFNFPVGMYDDQVDAFVQGILYNEPWLEQGLRRQQQGG